MTYASESLVICVEGSQIEKAEVPFDKSLITIVPKRRCAYKKVRFSNMFIITFIILDG